MSHDLHHGDCLDVLPTLPRGEVALIFADLPYAVTACKWDLAVCPERFWAEVSRAVAADSIVVLTGTFRFAALMLAKATLPFKYDLVWHKARASGFLNSKRAPLRSHEHLLVFGRGKPPYAPQMEKTWRPRRGCKISRGKQHGEAYNLGALDTTYQYTEERYPTSVLTPALPAAERGLHPTQKPVSLLEWVVATYTEPGQLVLDPTMGSGTTGVACARLGRRFVGVEKDPGYFAAAKARIEAAHAQAELGGSMVVSTAQQKDAQLCLSP